ncbi:MAG: DEAD/DEAH box helicase family protein [Glaciecola sp.]
MIKLRYYQQEAHDATISHCKVSNEPAMHNMSVGAGKTLSIAFDVKHVTDKGGQALVLARQGELIEQNSDDYRLIGGKCSIFSASLNRASTYYPAVFGTEGSVCRALQEHFNYKVHFIAIDEAHMVNWKDVLNCHADHKNGFDIYENKDENGKTKYSQFSIILIHFYSLNPKLRVIGYSGSPFRGSESVYGDFWKKELSNVSTYQLISEGFLVNPVFGFGDDSHHYDLKEFNKAEEGAGDYSQKELQAMGRKITKDKDMTQSIMEEVIYRTKDRLGVMITCASKKHCEQVAECLPDGSWGIVTDSTSTKERRRILSDAKSGKIKYLIQIGCLTTGINIPRLDTSVILRKIGSLTLVIQLLGRVLRTLKPEQMEEGMEKHDALILDYTDTLELMGNIYDDPIIDKATAAKAKQENQQINCPLCNTANSEYAVRCIGQDSNSMDGRCDHFFKSTMCLNCETENAPTAQNCRNCGNVMIDPNSKLVRKAYTDADYKPVKAMHYSESKNGKLCVMYELDSTYKKNGIENPEVAKEYFTIGSDDRVQRARWFKFIEQHIQGRNFRNSMARVRTPENVIRSKAMFDTPTEITHRVNDKGFSIINRKRFRSGREEKAS